MLRTRNAQPSLWEQVNAVRQRTHAALAFLNWLDARDPTLDTCRQADPAANPRPHPGHPHRHRVTWQRLSAGDWANYAAEVSSRPHPQRAE